MERRTKRLSSGAPTYNYPASCYFGDDSGPDRIAQSAFRQRCVERLADYEDTGRTPEEVTALGNLFDYALEESKTLTEQLALLNRIRKLAEADKDGRLVMLPCKVGQRVFALLDTDKHISECEVKQIGMGNKIGFIGLEPIGARGREYGVALNGFGKTVFLTREEAEKALEGMPNE